jgi:hypothetical protein
MNNKNSTNIPPMVIQEYKIISNVNAFPYNDWFVGEYDCNVPIVSERKAGYVEYSNRIVYKPIS